jgi:hypothetical protein
MSGSDNGRDRLIRAESGRGLVWSLLALSGDFRTIPGRDLAVGSNLGSGLIMGNFFLLAKPLIAGLVEAVLVRRLFVSRKQYRILVFQENGVAAPEVPSVSNNGRNRISGQFR